MPTDKKKLKLDFVFWFSSKNTLLCFWLKAGAVTNSENLIRMELYKSQLTLSIHAFMVAELDEVSLAISFKKH